MASHPNLVHVDDVAPVQLDQGPLRWTRRRLAAAAGAHAIGVSRFTVPPGGRTTPPHVHADEDELCFVLGGSGLSWQDGTTYAVAAGDVLLHLADAEAHTLIAGDDGLDVLMFGEGSRTSLTWLPRTQHFWAGRRWVPADSTHPFAAEAALPDLELPPPAAARPPTVCHRDELPATRYDERGYEGSERNAGAHLGKRHAGLRITTLDPGALSAPPHWHAREEECFYVLEGSGEALLGDDAPLALRPGSFLLRPPGTGVAHALRGGPDGMTFLAFGTHDPGDLVYYPRSKKLLAGQVVLRVTEADYWEGEL